MPRGLFISFEGGEGTGKSTQMGRLAEHLEGRGHRVVCTREPGGTALAEAVRAVLLDPAYSPDGWSEFFLLSAARHDHVTRLIRPELERGAVVLCDRFADSSLVYQGVVRGVGVDEVERISRLATGGLEPDLTLVFDLDPRLGLERARARNAEDAASETRLDDEPEPFHQKVREAYLWLLRHRAERARLVDASGDPDQVFRTLLAALPRELQ